MENHGVIAQFGFEFQKLVFLHYALQLNVFGSVVYEGKDDVELSDKDYIFSIRQDSRYVQVKSGEITEQTFEKVLCNWLIDYKKEVDYICFTELPITIDYSSDSFMNCFINNIKTKGKRSDSLYVKVKKKYDVLNDESLIRTTLKDLLSQIEIICKSVKDLEEESIGIFIHGYCDDTKIRFLQEKRFSRLKEKLFSLISNSIIQKEACQLTHGTLFDIASSIKEELTDDHYEENFNQFKKKSKEQVEKILASENDSVKQLKLVFHNNPEKIVGGLEEQAFYEDWRAVFIHLNKENDIISLEELAHSNYEDVLNDIEENGETRTPYLTYKRTTSQDLRSKLFSQHSSNFKFYNRGCYIHLTDSGIPDNLKIKWGEDNDQ